MKTYKQDVMTLAHAYIGRTLASWYPDIEKKWKLDFQLQFGKLPSQREQSWFIAELKKTISEHFEVSSKARECAREKRLTQPRPYCPECQKYWDTFTDACECGAPLIEREPGPVQLDIEDSLLYG